MRARAAKWPRACRGLAWMALLRRRRRRERTRGAEGRTHGGKHESRAPKPKGKRNRHKKATRVENGEDRKGKREHARGEHESRTAKTARANENTREANTSRGRWSQRANEDTREANMSRGRRSQSANTSGHNLQSRGHMQIQREDLNPCTVRLEITCDPEQVKVGFEKAYKQAAKKIKVPGFRPGHAPRAILEQSVNPEYLKELATENIIRDAYKQATEQLEL